MKFQFLFDNPNLISTGLEPDTLVIFINLEWFLQSADGLSIAPNTEIRRELPRQVSLE